jgi:excisionase family DNA binding protein
VGTPEVLSELDRIIEASRPEERPALVVALSARLAALGAQMTASASPERQSAEDEVLAMSEVAKTLGKDEETVRRMGRKGELPTVAVGRRGMGVRRGSLREWIRKRERRSIGTH